MTTIVEHLNRAFENRIRLAVMSILVVNDSADFNTLKEMLHLTDGNLATHAAALEKRHYIRITKVFAGKKTLTTYYATPAGRKAFAEHLDALEKIIRQSK